MNCCNANGDCRQGRDCPARMTSYKKHFTHLGDPVTHTPPPWTIPDLLIVLLAVLCLAGLVSGVFQ